VGRRPPRRGPRHAGVAGDRDARPREPLADRDLVPPPRGPAPDTPRSRRAAGDPGAPGTGTRAGDTRRAAADRREPGRRPRAGDLHAGAAVARPVPPRPTRGGRVGSVRVDAPAP